MKPPQTGCGQDRGQEPHTRWLNPSEIGESAPKTRHPCRDATGGQSANTHQSGNQVWGKDHPARQLLLWTWVGDALEREWRTSHKRRSTQHTRASYNSSSCWDLSFFWEISLLMPLSFSFLFAHIWKVLAGSSQVPLSPLFILLLAFPFIVQTQDHWLKPLGGASSTGLVQGVQVHDTWPHLLLLSLASDLVLLFPHLSFPKCMSVPGYCEVGNVYLLVNNCCESPCTYIIVNLPVLWIHACLVHAWTHFLSWRILFVLMSI